MLLANCLAQVEALALGRTADEAKAQLDATGMSAEDVAALVPHKVFAGNRPSSLLFYDKLTPKMLGRLIALYEQKVFVQGVVWGGVNSYDQWGGLSLAKNWPTNWRLLSNREIAETETLPFWIA